MIEYIEVLHSLFKIEMESFIKAFIFNVSSCSISFTMKGSPSVNGQLISYLKNQSSAKWDESKQCWIFKRIIIKIHSLNAETTLEFAFPKNIDINAINTLVRSFAIAYYQMQITLLNDQCLIFTTDIANSSLTRWKQFGLSSSLLYLIEFGHQDEQYKFSGFVVAEQIPITRIVILNNSLVALDNCFTNQFLSFIKKNIGIIYRNDSSFFLKITTPAGISSWTEVLALINNLSKKESGNPSLTKRPSHFRHNIKNAGNSYKVDLHVQDLKKLNIVSQIDFKFILCRLIRNSSTEFIIFDQHAVHERIRLEKFERDLLNNEFPLVSCKFSITIPIFIVDDETLKKTTARWGVLISSLSYDVHESSTSFEIMSISTFIMDSIDDNDNSLILKKIICGLVDMDLAEKIPQELYEIAKSRACRGAIKFGDKLELDAMNDLISGLSSCKFPFICAHGRTSIAHLGSYPD